VSAAPRQQGLASSWVIAMVTVALVGFHPRAAEAEAEAPDLDRVGEPSFAPASAESSDSKIECLKHYEEAQLARREGRLLEARAELLLCSLASCPGAIRADCVDWIEQVSRSVPSVVVTARAQGRDIANVKVFVDDHLVAERLSGAAFDVDPGEHRFRFESDPWPSVDRTILVSEGVKGRAIDIEFAPVEPETDRPLPVATPAPTPAANHRLQGIDYALGGVALASLGTFAVAGSWALYQRHDLQQRCAPFCNDSEVRSVATKLVVADVALGAAVVSLAVLYFHASRSSDAAGPSAARASSLCATAQATRQGVELGVRGAF
jgi:hypothetical protein